MKRFSMVVTIDVTENAGAYDVRKAVEACVKNALHIFAETAHTSRPHPLTRNPIYTFGYDRVAVSGTWEEPQ